MIKFESLKWRNFLSTGDKFTEVNLSNSLTTLVIGQNGSGKSTMLDALSFALFGKAHRNISKAQIVNTINSKACVVEVKFSVGGKNFKVVRGIKPNVFEIWANGEMLDQESHSRDYQKILEQNILKLNHKSFHQIVVLGSSSFVPFMQLPSNHRRDVIEDLLDIGVFSKMNLLLKEKASALREQIRQNETLLQINKNSIDNQKKYIRSITEINLANRDQKAKLVEDTRAKVAELNLNNAFHTSVIDKQLEPVQEAIDKILARKQAVDGYQTQFSAEMRRIVKEAKFYETNDVCPECSQPIDINLKEHHITSAKERAQELQQGIDQSRTTLRSMDEEYNMLLTQSLEINELQKSIHSNNRLISSLNSTIESTNTELDMLSVGTEDLSKANLELDELDTAKLEISEVKYQHSEQQQYYGITSELLKDTGIKTKIIKQYLPVINNLVNQYLQTLDFYVHFNLDENFKETVRSRHRDEFSYDSFSEGEKQRIDLSLLFTWRMIAKMKNSVATNLLILDETFDSSLDHDGIENLMKILNTLEKDTNTFVISHKGDILEGKFEDKIEFYKDKNFSKIRIAA
jgi:DNA repair exonuclease SbcCD ATPase subunit